MKYTISWNAPHKLPLAQAGDGKIPPFLFESITCFRHSPSAIWIEALESITFVLLGTAQFTGGTLWKYPFD